jgi:hypothetical protein
VQEDEPLGDGWWQIRDGVDAVYWSDPEWEGALNELRDKRGKPLADLMRRGGKVPVEVRKSLADLLDPPWGNKGPSLRYFVPKNSDHRRKFALIGKKLRFRDELMTEYAKAKKLEAAICAMQEKHGNSRSFWMDVYSLDEAEFVRRAEAITSEPLSQTPRSPKSDSRKRPSPKK